MSRMAPDRSQDFGTGPDFVSSGRDVTGPFIGASTVGTTASAGYVLPSEQMFDKY